MSNAIWTILYGIVLIGAFQTLGLTACIGMLAIAVLVLAASVLRASEPAMDNNERRDS